MIGTLALEADKKGIKTLIATGDKHVAQLVTENIHLIDTMKDLKWVLQSQGKVWYSGRSIY